MSALHVSNALRRTRHRLGALLAARALLGGVATTLVVVAFARALAAIGRGDAVPPWSPLLALAAGLSVAFALRLRDGRLTDRRVALWVEERAPGLDYALVTAADPRHAALAPLLSPRLAAVPWDGLLRRAARRALLPFGVACAAALLVAMVIPARPLTIVDAAGNRGAADAANGTRPPRGSALASIRATVRPPAYSRLPVQTLDDPTSVPGLVGSRVELHGEIDAAVTATIGDERVTATRDDGWTLRFTMPATPTVVRLADGPHTRLVVLEPRADSVPVVTLLPGASDTVVRTPTGTIPFGARAHDDVGLATGAFEYIVSSGEGESFSFRSGTLGATTFGGRRDGELRAMLDLAGLQLKPGDVVHVRAVARDGNTLSGPGVGASETRAVRVARIGEGDSVAVEGAPPSEADTAAISQRMLLLLTERLEERRPRLTRDTVLAEAQRISRDQTRLRKRVGELVYMRLGEAVDGEHSHFAGDGHDHGAEGPLNTEQLLARASAATGGAMPGVTDFHGDETPVVAVNKPLLEAYNHMWDASRALDVGEPSNAIPPMRLAIAALQRARAAERIYLRGRPPTVVVDLARVRLQGEERGEGSTRDPRAALDAAELERLRRLDAALAMLADAHAQEAESVVAVSAAAAVADSLLLLRVDALGENDVLARALDDAVRALRAGRDATDALLRARRAAAGTPVTSPVLPRWGSGW